MFTLLKRKIKKTKIKKLLNEQQAKKILFPLIKKVSPRLKKIDDFKIEILRNFLGKFRNLTVRYTFLLNYGKVKKREKFLAKINALSLAPRKWFEVSKILKKRGFKEIPKILAYLPTFNTVLYQEVKGESLQHLLEQKKISKVIKIVPQISLLLKKFHSLKIKKFFIKKDRKEENREYRHWLFLIRKCAPRFEKRFKKTFRLLKKFREKNKTSFLKEKDYLLTHGDFHFGNLILMNKKIKMIDFTESEIYDPLNDVASFLSQTESMLRYYFPQNFLIYQKKIENLFLKNYFRREVKKNEKIRIKFFKIRNFLQMAGVLSFVTGPKRDKFLAVKKSLDLAEKELKSKI
ncbi:MAG: aminoglycoside phosphotransferase family protein [Patescibacteria group bacterium]|nr:aminoglycoside phosphotransferase family protein [Patescibacteria group bacterium]